MNVIKGVFATALAIFISNSAFASNINMQPFLKSFSKKDIQQMDFIMLGESHYNKNIREFLPAFTEFIKSIDPEFNCILVELDKSINAFINEFFNNHIDASKVLSLGLDKYFADHGIPIDSDTLQFMASNHNINSELLASSKNNNTLIFGIDEQNSTDFAVDVYREKAKSHSRTRSSIEKDLQEMGILNYLPEKPIRHFKEQIIHGRNKIMVDNYIYLKKSGTCRKAIVVVGEGHASRENSIGKSYYQDHQLPMSGQLKQLGLTGITLDFHNSYSAYGFNREQLNLNSLNFRVHSKNTTTTGWNDSTDEDGTIIFYNKQQL